MRLLISSNRYNLIASPFAKFPVYSGVISSNSASRIYDDNASWTVGAYAKQVPNQETAGKSTFYVETGGESDKAGWHFYVTNNDATSLMLERSVPGDLATNGLAGVAYNIVPAWRIRDIFGEPDQPILAGGSSVTSADYVVFWNGSNNWEAGPVYYRMGATQLPSLNTNWVSGISRANDKIIDRDTGVFVQQKAPRELVLNLSGRVWLSRQMISINSNYSLVGGGWGRSQAIGHTGLSGVIAGSSGLVSATEYVLPWDETKTNWQARVYYRVSVTQSNWYQGIKPNVDNTYMLGGGRAYLLRAQTNKVWQKTSPVP